MHWLASEHRRRSGRDHDEKQEEKRRLGTAYGAAMERMRASAGRKKSASASFLVHMDDCLTTLRERQRELVSKKRSIARFQRKRNKQSAVARAADDIVGSVSTRGDKAAFREAYAFRAGAPKLSEEERRKLVHKVRRIRQERKAARARGAQTAQPKMPVVVFYGDGGGQCVSSNFPHQQVRRQIGLRALHVSLSEAYTSQMCPCSVGLDCIFTSCTKAADGDGVLLSNLSHENAAAPQAEPSSATEPRFRAHKSGGGCPIVGRLRNMPTYTHIDKTTGKRTVCCDRDDLAALNILHVGRSWYDGHGRPQAFRWRKG